MRQGHLPLDADLLQVVPVTPDLGRKYRRLGKGEIIEPLLLSRLQQRSQSAHIEGAVDKTVVVPGAVIGLKHGFQSPFGAHDL